MWFAVATLRYWKSRGFNTENWRVSYTYEGDDRLALVHEKYAEALCGSLEDDSNVKSYDVDTDEFSQLIREHFTEKAEDITETE